MNVKKTIKTLNSYSSIQIWKTSINQAFQPLTKTQPLFIFF